jgi:feruloyl esterase
MGELSTTARLGAGASLLAALIAVGVAASRTDTARAADSPAAPKACADMAGMTFDGGKVRIDKAAVVPASAPGTVRAGGPASSPISVAIPAYCLVEGMADARKGEAGVAYGLGFQIALPNAWNGRFLFQGGGGTNGVIRPPLGVQAAGEIPALARGFAVISTDGGHKATAPGFDSSFRKDQQAVVDFAYNSVARVTVIGKALVATYYGTAPDHSYFVGCSTGGREAMLAAQRNALEYDGVIAGAPAMRTSYSNLGLTWKTVAFNRIAPKDAAGKPLSGQALTADDKTTFTSGLLAACDSLDGLKDGLIENTQACKFDPAVLQCKAGQATGCLTADKVTAIKTAFGGAKNQAGRQIYSPYPYDTGVTVEKEGTIAGFIPGRIPPMQGATDELAIDVDARDAAAQANIEHGPGSPFYWTNLTTFFGHGGKVIFYHGMSDPWFSALDTVDYYGRLQKDGGDQAKAASALYLAPGMGHCQGGEAFDRFDLLSQLVDWTEHAKPPTAPIATGAAFPGQSRPICPYPAYPHYDGKGDPKSAASFQCRA